MSVSGFDFSSVLKVVAAKKQTAINAAQKAVDVFGEHVLGDAAQLAPVGGGMVSPNDPAPGTLQGSATTLPATIDGEKIEKVIGFNTVYAAVQHEELDFNHDVGQAKYLETAMRQNTPKMGAFVAKQVKAAIEG